MIKKKKDQAGAGARRKGGEKWEIVYSDNSNLSCRGLRVRKYGI